MKISKLTLCNFRCFGPEPVSVDLANFSTLIGANGAGKTAILQALVRLFSIHPAERRLHKSDFHFPPDAANGSINQISLWLRVKIEFPGHVVGDSTGIPECFQQMMVPHPGGDPYCYIQLSATWNKTLQVEGEIEEQLCWSTTETGDGTKLTNHERSYIKVIYVPATRDPAAQLRQTAGSLLQPVLRAILWPTSVSDEAETSANRIREIIRQEPGMQRLEEKIAEEWQRLQDFPPLREVILQPFNSDFTSLVQRIDAFFQKCDGANPQAIDRLSDGLRSLFFFALLGARFEIEQQALTALIENRPSPFHYDLTDFSLLTFFAIEEPENHLAPHYLTHIVALLKRLSKYDRNQVLLTSQSPAILGRIDPLDIRHVRYDQTTCGVSVQKLTLPPTESEAFKYIKEAVRAYPELYFAKAVVLGEGDSEAIVLPRIAAALGSPLEEQFISFVPLSGRFVHHFWKLLNELEIPHFTLLDLDRERFGAYWLRIKYAIDQLIAHRTDFILADIGLTQAQYNALASNPVEDDATLYLQALEKEGVFFSEPLDLDFLMLRAFPEAYQQAEEGSRGPVGLGTSSRILSAAEAVLKPEGTRGHTYSPSEREAFVWYQYLFLGRSKPLTHLLALNRLDVETIKNNLPPMLQRLIDKVAGQPVPVV